MIVFRSEVGPDIMMFDDVARHMMELMGKEKSGRGVVTVEQIPDAIGRLKAAAMHDRTLPRDDKPGDDGDTGESAPPVSLTQRVVPLIELLEISLAQKTPVTWGI